MTAVMTITCESSTAHWKATKGYRQDIRILRTMLLNLVECAEANRLPQPETIAVARKALDIPEPTE